jgi:hypothetical protein
MLQHLRSVRWDANPLLKSPAELTEEGLPGMPYMSLPEHESLRP